MKYKRKFVIKLLPTDSSITSIDVYVKDVTKITIGYNYTVTYKIEEAKIWKYKKNCENSIDILENKLDLIKEHLKNIKFQLVEITDKQTLRHIKLTKINNK